MNRIVYVLGFSVLFLYACKNETKNILVPSSGQSALFDSYFDLFPQASFAHPGGLNMEREAFMLYNANHLDKSTDAFITLYESHHFPRHKFYAAISNLGRGQTDTAITQLEELDREGKLSMKFVHQYFLGLAYLKKGRKADAKEMLAKVGNNFRHYKVKADELIAKI